MLFALSIACGAKHHKINDVAFTMLFVISIACGAKHHKINDVAFTMLCVVSMLNMVSIYGVSLSRFVYIKAQCQRT